MVQYGVKLHLEREGERVGGREEGGGRKEGGGREREEREGGL